jgi:hypothetical protein
VFERLRIYQTKGQGKCKRRVAMTGGGEVGGVRSPRGKCRKSIWLFESERHSEECHLRKKREINAENMMRLATGIGGG